MISEKLITLLRHFSKYDLNRFRKFLQSSYFNDQTDVIELFDLCNAELRRDPVGLEKLEKAVVWKRLYPGRPFDDGHWRRLTSDLTRLALRFVGQEYRQAVPVREWLDQHTALRDPGLAKHRGGIQRLLERHWQQPGTLSPAFYDSYFKIHVNNSTRATITMFGSDFVNDLEQADFHLDAYYAVHKLKLYTTWLTFRELRTTERELTVISGFLEYIGQERFRQEPLIQVYLSELRCLVEPEEEAHFRMLLDVLQQHGHMLASEELREGYHFAQNYCAFKINQGKTEYYREVFEIYRRIIDENILVENGELSEGVYKNVITVSLGVGEYEWAENFIQNYAGFLPAAIRENARTYNLSYLFFYQKKYGRVVELLRDVEYSDVTYALGAKQMLLRTYYETQEYMALDSLIDSFRIYVRRNKVISKDSKRKYNNFVNFLKKLLALEGAPKPALAAFRKQVSESQYLTPKKWLLEKIDELEKR